MKIKVTIYSRKKVLFTVLTTATLSLYLGTGNLNTVNAKSLTGRRLSSFKNINIKKKTSLHNKKIGNAVTVEPESTEGKVDSELPKTISIGSDSAQTSNKDEQVQSSMQENYNYDITEHAEELHAKDQLAMIEPRSVVKAKWSGLEVTFDNGLLIVPSGAVTNPTRFSTSFKNINAKDITKIKFTGSLSISGSADYLFDSLENLTEIEGMPNLSTSGVTSMKFMFGRCAKLTTLDLSSFDTSQVTNMARMFLSDSKLEEIILDVSKFSTAKVVDTWGMFGGCESLKSVDVSHFDTAQVKNMNGMFLQCSSLTSIDVSHFNTDSVANMLGMFWQCSSLESLDLSSFNMTSSTINNNMLKSLTKLNTLILGKNNYLIGTGLDTPGIWQRDHAVTPVRKWNSADLMANYNGATDYGTYVRFISVLAHYRDQENKTVAPDETLTGKSGTSYPNQPLAGYVQISKPEGQFSDSETEVTYYYTNEVTVTAHYVDQNGNQLADDATLKGKIGTPYPDQPIAGYVQISKPEGQFSDSETEVTYYYTNEVTVTAHYVDQNGNQLADDATLKGKIGDSYPDKTIAGYVLASKSSNQFTDGVAEVTYHYTKAATPRPGQTIQGAAVTVHYQDAKGNTLASDEVLTGKVGAGYVSAAKTIAGYKLVMRPGNATGFFSQNPQSVTYIYAPVESENGQQPEQNGSGSGNSGNNGQSQAAHHSNSKGKRPHGSQNNNQTQTGKRGQGHKATATEKEVTKETESGKQLPQTGSTEGEKTAAWLLGSLSVLGGLIGFWINRRKKKN